MDRNPYDCKNRGIQSNLKSKRNNNNRSRSYPGQTTRRSWAVRRDNWHKIIKNYKDRPSWFGKQEMDSYFSI
jgi:hypothetical protein